MARLFTRTAGHSGRVRWRLAIDIIIIMDRVREKGPNQQIWQHLLSGTDGIDREAARSATYVLLHFF